MTDLLKETLQRQFDIAWQLTSHHLDGLTDQECLWKPATLGLHVEQTAGGPWHADWPDREEYDIGPASIAWLTWHLGFWWSMTLNHSFGDATLSRESVTWPGDAQATVSWITDLQQQWRTHLQNITNEQLQSAQLSRWPLRDCPFSDVVAWANIELTKNAAEIGYARFLYAAQNGPSR